MTVTAARSWATVMPSFAASASICLPSDGSFAMAALSSAMNVSRAPTSFGSPRANAASADGSVDAICASTAGGRSTKRSSPPTASSPATTSAEVRPTSTLSCAGVRAARADSSGRGSRASWAISGSTRAAAASFAGEASASGARSPSRVTASPISAALSPVFWLTSRTISALTAASRSAGGAGGQSAPARTPPGPATQRTNGSAAISSSAGVIWASVAAEVALPVAGDQTTLAVASVTALPLMRSSSCWAVVDCWPGSAKLSL